MFGYCVNEVGLPMLQSDLISYINTNVCCAPIRRPVMRSLGPHLIGFAPPTPDPFAPLNIHQGIIKRLCPKRTFDKNVMRRFRSFVRVFLRKHFCPFSCDETFDFEEWLVNCSSYNEARREQLRAVHKKLEDGDTTCKIRISSFVKRESYPCFKYPRIINSRHDSFKVKVGPYIKKLENYVYSTLESFIKHVPVLDRPRYIMDHLLCDGMSYYGTDYSTYEGRQIAEVLKACEIQLYSYMFKNFPDIVVLLRNALLSDPTLHFRSGLAYGVPACRMSGEMSTSLGNGFLNLMAIMFLCKEKHINIHGVVVEGDDGLISASSFPTAQDFAKLNLEIKVEKFNKISEASFCGLLFTEEGNVVVDPKKKLLKFGWTNSAAMYGSNEITDGLLKAKCFSLLVEAPGCPITTKLASKTLQLLGSVKPIYERDYRTKELIDIVDKVGVEAFVDQTPTYKQRQLVDQIFGISVCLQIALEKWIDSWNDLSPKNSALLDQLDYGFDCITTASRYVITISKRDSVVHWF